MSLRPEKIHGLSMTSVPYLIVGLMRSMLTDGVVEGRFVLDGRRRSPGVTSAVREIIRKIDVGSKETLGLGVPDHWGRN